MSARSAQLEFKLERPGSGFFFRMLLAWAGILTAAMLYCVLHGAIVGDFEFRPGVMLRWTVVHWGAWPLLLPLSFWLIRFVQRRVNLVVGVVAAVPLTILGSALFAYLADLGLGGEWTLVQAVYHMTPIAAGTYAVFVTTAFFLLYPSILSVATREASVADERTDRLPVWKGRLQTTISADSVEWIRAAKNYVELFAGGEAYLMRCSMTELERLLPAERFLRIHRSYLVNTGVVTGIRRGKGKPYAVLQSGSRLPIGPTYREAAFSSLNRGIGPGNMA